MLPAYAACGISIHALLAESDVGQKRLRQKLAISIHALLAESDVCVIQLIECRFVFLSTLSLRRATSIFMLPLVLILLFLSTLSLRRATSFIQIKDTPKTNFYPRSPCGERQVHTLIFANPVLFLSTLSLRRATDFGASRPKNSQISIHALLAESDPAR